MPWTVLGSISALSSQEYLKTDIVTAPIAEPLMIRLAFASADWTKVVDSYILLRTVIVNAEATEMVSRSHKIGIINHPVFLNLEFPYKYLRDMAISGTLLSMQFAILRIIPRRGRSIVVGEPPIQLTIEHWHL